MHRRRGRRGWGARIGRWGTGEAAKAAEAPALLIEQVGQGDHPAQADGQGGPGAAGAGAGAVGPVGNGAGGDLGGSTFVQSASEPREGANERPPRPETKNDMF